MFKFSNRAAGGQRVEAMSETSAPALRQYVGVAIIFVDNIRCFIYVRYTGYADELMFALVELTGVRKHNSRQALVDQMT